MKRSHILKDATHLLVEHKLASTNKWDLVTLQVGYQNHQQEELFETSQQASEQSHQATTSEEQSTKTGVTNTDLKDLDTYTDLEQAILDTDQISTIDSYQEDGAFEYDNDILADEDTDEDSLDILEDIDHTEVTHTSNTIPSLETFTTQQHTKNQGVFTIADTQHLTGQDEERIIEKDTTVTIPTEVEQAGYQELGSQVLENYTKEALLSLNTQALADKQTHTTTADTSNEKIQTQKKVRLPLERQIRRLQESLWQERRRHAQAREEISRLYNRQHSGYYGRNNNTRRNYSRTNSYTQRYR